MPSKWPKSSFDPAASTPVVSGTLGGRLETLRAAVPFDVRTAADRIEWIPTGADGGSSWWPNGGNAAAALGAFIKLAGEKREDRFCDFVRTYGVLGLTESGLPGCGSTWSMSGPPQLAESWQGCAVSWEPLAAYRHYAAGAKAMVCLATALRHGQGRVIVSPRSVFSAAGLEVDDQGVWDRTKRICQVWQGMSGRSWEEWWEMSNGSATHMNLHRLDPAHVAHNFSYSVDLYGPLNDSEAFASVQRQKFGLWLTDFWLKPAGLVPTITWTEEQAQLGLSVGKRRDDYWEYWPPNSLFRILAAHLAAIVCSGANTAICSHCNEVYFPMRRPRIDQAHFCEECRVTSASRRTQRWRERRRLSSDHLA